MRDHLDGELGETLSTEEERENIRQALSQASDWLDDDGWDAKADVSISVFKLYCSENTHTMNNSGFIFNGVSTT